MRRITFALLSFIILTLGFLALTGKFPPELGIGNPTAKDILKNNPDADIVQLDGLVYANVTDIDRFQDRNYQIGEKIGEVAKQTNRTWFYRDFFSSKLPEGTEIYMTNQDTYTQGDAPSLIIAEHKGEALIYMAYREG